MGMAGGLTNLTKMPSCNILLLGAHKKFLSGFSSTTAMPHAGAIFYSKIVQDCPPVSQAFIFLKIQLIFLFFRNFEFV
jgi:U4/U6 small nuclear ribonucleoprotein PRP31